MGWIWSHYRQVFDETFHSGCFFLSFFFLMGVGVHYFPSLELFHNYDVFDIYA